MIIYKYEIKGRDVEIEMPIDAEIIHFGEDGMGNLCVWAESNEEKTEIRRFKVVFTGERFYEPIVGCKSFVKKNGIVLHLLEIAPDLDVGGY